MNNYEDNSEKLPGVAAFSGKFTQSTGVLNLNTKENNINIDIPSRYVTTSDNISNQNFEKALFEKKLFELDLLNDFAQKVIESLDENFTYNELESIISVTDHAA